MSGHRYDALLRLEKNQVSKGATVGCTEVNTCHIERFRGEFARKSAIQMCCIKLLLQLPPVVGRGDPSLTHLPTAHSIPPIALRVYTWRCLCRRATTRACMRTIWHVSKRCVHRKCRRLRLCLIRVGRSQHSAASGDIIITTWVVSIVVTRPRRHRHRFIRLRVKVMTIVIDDCFCYTHDEVCLP